MPSWTDRPTRELLDSLPQTGRVEWIGLRPARREPLVEVATVKLDVADGLSGDHYRGRSGKRQVTLIQQEHLAVVAQLLGRAVVTPAEVRRNIVVSGINLLAFSGRQFQVGEEVVLEMTAPCSPCSRMETHLGPGGYNAMRGHGGICARIIVGGTIRLGDAVRLRRMAEPAENS